MQLALAPQVPRVFRAFAHHFAALQNDRLQAHLRKHHRCQHAARTEADHDGACVCFCVNRCGVRHEFVARVWRFDNLWITLEALEDRKLVAFAQLYVERVNELNVCLFARVVAAAKHSKANELKGFDAEPRDDGGG